MVALLILFSGLAVAHEGHEHASNIPTQVKWGLSGAQEIMNIHPLFVHFPIALLLAATFFYFAGLLTRKENFFLIGKWLIILGSVSAALAVWTGLRAEDTVAHGGDTHQILMAHQYLGVAVLTLSATLSLWLIIIKSSLPAKGRVLFYSSLLILSVLIVQQADLGGRMVFLHGVGVGRKSVERM